MTLTMRSLHGKQWWILCCCSVASACSDGGFGGTAEQGCPKELREISPDAEFGDAVTGYQTPRDVIRLLERPTRGTVSWSDNGDSEYLEVTGAAGTAAVTARATVGPTVWLRPGVVGKGGVSQRLYCPTEFVFDVSIHIESEDGALTEDWAGPGTFTIGGGGVRVWIEDPPPFAGTLRITERAGVREAWDERGLSIQLSFSTYPVDVAAMTGVMQYFLENQGDGELYGVNTTIAEFARPVDDTTGG